MVQQKKYDLNNLSSISGLIHSGRTGPKTTQGKAIAARNATSHGLFSRDIVLPQLGEDPDAYNTLYFQLCEQLNPHNFLERHYVEEIAAASWRLRRLHRWQAQLYEDETLTEDERLNKLDRVLRHETALHRQIDKSVRLLGRDVPQLFEGRARNQALAALDQTERSCRFDDRAEAEVSQQTRDNLQFGGLPSRFDYACLDNTHLVPAKEDAPAACETQICQNEIPVAGEAVVPAAAAQKSVPNQAGISFPGGVSKGQKEKIVMYKGLSPGAIGVRAANLDEALAAAKTGGFGGVEFNPSEIADLIAAQGAEAVRARFDEAGIKPAGWGLPIDWRGSEENWQNGLKELPRLAEAAGVIGGTRVSTWIMPGSNDKEPDENYQFHVARFTPIAKILGDHGVSLGLEFIGPKTLRDTQKYPFIHTMADMLAMGREIGPNVGLLLDAYHWYTSHGTIADLQALTPAQVVYVHVNDAPRGVPVDAQLDGVRALPGATGVIDIAGFLQSLRGIGYDGPVTPEPFVNLSELPSDEARLHKIGAAMDEIWKTAGL